MSGWQPERLAQPPALFNVDQRIGPTGEMFFMAGSHTLSTVNAWPAANRALFFPVIVERPLVIVEFITQFQTASGNVDMGIYDEAGNRLVSTGSSAIGSTSQLIVDVVDTEIGIGVYYLAMAHDGVVNVLSSSTPTTLLMRAAGVKQQDSAFPLPATATFANITVARIPGFGAITRPAT
jgi:hypothetical protein